MIVQKLSYLPESPSQTAGPYVHIGCTPNHAGITGVWDQDLGAEMLGPNARGQRITISGVIYDGTGAPVRDAMVEIWQADAHGLYASPIDPHGPGDPDFSGFGRCPTDAETGLWRFETIKPGRVPHPNDQMQAPHIALWIAARGINIGLQTRLYFADEAEANAADPVLAMLEHQNRAQTLIAATDGPDAYRLDIHLQGPDETVFFDA